jgi:L-Ala-D/L-Glu epimerase
VRSDQSRIKNQKSALIRMPTHITGLTAYRVRIPLKKKIQHASHTRTYTDSVVVRCQLSNGLEGWGEGLPREYVTGETIDDIFPLLDESPLQAQLRGPLDSIPEAIDLCEQIELKRPTEDARECFGNSARCAIELSILDAVCRTEEVPLSDITRQFPQAVSVRGDSDFVRYSAAITSMKPWKQKLNAWLFRLHGFHQTKVKVGTAGISDVESLARIRKILGPKIDIRIDANEAWNCDDLQSTLEPLLPFEISSLEQPVLHEQVDGLAKLRGNIGVDLMLDESLCSLIDARRAIEFGLCDLFNIRISKCGGFLNSLKLAAIAKQAGLGYQLGCQVGETGILSAAGRHWASSVADIRYVEGSYDQFLVRERLTVENLTFKRKGLAPAISKPGLGITIDERALQRVTTDTLKIGIT